MDTLVSLKTDGKKKKQKKEKISLSQGVDTTGPNGVRGPEFTRVSWDPSQRVSSTHDVLGKNLTQFTVSL